MSFHCFSCNSQQDISNSSRVGRKDTCHKCNADLHCCLNCSHFDRNAYNSCRESQAERVLDKERGNFCDYFSYKAGSLNLATVNESKSTTIKKLDELFKK